MGTDSDDDILLATELEGRKTGDMAVLDFPVRVQRNSRHADHG